MSSAGGGPALRLAQGTPSLSRGERAEKRDPLERVIERIELLIPDRAKDDALIVEEQMDHQQDARQEQDREEARPSDVTASLVKNCANNARQRMVNGPAPCMRSRLRHEPAD
jgi:hypothetical protein